MTKQLTTLEYLGMSSIKRFGYRSWNLILSLPHRCMNLLRACGRFFKKFGLWCAHTWIDIWQTFKYGDWKARLSFIVMGFDNICHGQWLRGCVFLLFEAVFIWFMIAYGGLWLARLALSNLQIESIESPTITRIAGSNVVTTEYQYADNSINYLIWGILTLFICIAAIWTWRLNVRQSKLLREDMAQGKRLHNAKDDGYALIDRQFHRTVLALPTIGILIFTVMPIILMIMVAFTNFDAYTQPPMNSFEWVGGQNWSTIFTWSNGGNAFMATFGELLYWTLLWAFFATFTNYFLGMFVAMMINKKGIKLKKMWRTLLVITIAVPQFISLLYLSHMFDRSGLVNSFFGSDVGFWENKWIARVMVIVINIWVGIPYLMLITTGVLMNIPADLYESAKIDGANAMQMYGRITLPYMLFVTGPYLLTSFTGNMNNFNVIYLLTGGNPSVGLYKQAGGTDLLITWLFKLTTQGDHSYYLASIIGIFVFVVVAVVSLIVYNIIPSTRNEEDFA
ncbi:MAG: sugar ABC transporter permease [Coprobacillus sp.]|nr:sugar ABC transporter permease [Coprobacillus sp.]